MTDLLPNVSSNHYQISSFVIAWSHYVVCKMNGAVRVFMALLELFHGDALMG